MLILMMMSWMLLDCRLCICMFEVADCSMTGKSINTCVCISLSPGFGDGDRMVGVVPGVVFGVEVEDVFDL